MFNLITYHLKYHAINKSLKQINKERSGWVWDIRSSGRELGPLSLPHKGNSQSLQSCSQTKEKRKKTQGVADVHIVGDLCSGRVMESHSLILLTGAG